MKGMIKIRQIITSLRPINIIVGAMYSYLAFWYINQKELGILFALCVVYGLAAGNIINDIFDKKTDSINKPHKARLYKSIGLKPSYYIYLILISFSLITSIFSQNSILILIVIISNLLLYFYGRFGKKMGFLGNFLVSFLCALSIGAPIFTHYHMPNEQFETLTLLCFLAFVFSFMREWIKDMEDIKGDLHMSAQTGVIRLGYHKSNTLLKYYGVLLALLLFAIPFIFNNVYYGIWFLLFIPVLYYLFKKSSRLKFKTISTLLKFLFLSGILIFFI